ncbi:MAG: hypothetical protein GHCLOJNM_04373 [bacterium]|nr:hypothetical protein [bacterium]
MKFIPGFLVLLSVTSLAAPGDWPEPRQNPHLTGIQPVPAGMKSPPRILGRFDLGRTQPSIHVVPEREGQSPLALSVVAGELLCHDDSGTSLWKTHPPGLNFTQVVTIEDLDGDGTFEALLSAGRPTQPYGAAALVSIADGHLLWRYDVEPMSYSWNVSADDYLETAGRKQLIVLMHAYPPDEKNGYIVLFDFPKPGAPPEQVWRYDFDSYTCFPSLLRTDLDGDGRREVVVETHSKMWVFDAPTGKVKQFLEWDVSPANVRSYGHVEFVDLNGDGREDFLCIATFAQHHEVLLNRGGLLEKAWHYGWDESVTIGKVASLWPDPPYADVDGDGNLEVVVSMFNSEGESAWLIRVYDAESGRMKYRRPGMLATGLEDLDGNGKAEIAANRCADPTRTDLEGAVVLEAATPEFRLLWEDTHAVFPETTGRGKRGKQAALNKPASEDAFPLQREGSRLQVTWRSGQGYVVGAEPERQPKPKDAFSARPAIAGGPVPELLAGDLIGDDRNEILIFRDPNYEILSVTPSGEIVSVTGGVSSGLPLIVDLDGDGAQELVTGQVDPVATPILVARTPSKGNRLLWRSVFPSPDRPGLPAPRKLYMRSVHFTGKPTPDLYVWASTPIVRSVGVDGLSGKLLWDKGEAEGIERYWGASVDLASAFDFNRDGNEDLIFTNPDYYCVADGPTGGSLLGPLYPPNIFKQPSQGLYTFPAILDSPSGDPTVALVSGHYFQAAMSLRAAPYWYKLPLCGEAPSAVETFLQLPSGEWLMGFGRQDGKFVCLNVKDGSRRWELDVQGTCSDPATLDVDGDGIQEFVFGTSHKALYAVGEGGSVSRVVWKAELSAGVGNLIAADVTGDGRCEILAPTTDGFLNVLSEQ